jgi:hypothetical protein
MAQQAQDTFVAEVDGAPLMVQKGDVFADKHPVVKVDGGRGLLFRPLDIDGQPAKVPGSKVPAKAAG